MTSTPVAITGASLDLDQVRQVARSGRQAALAVDARKRVAEAAALLSELTATDQTIYGVNTGFGIFADRHIQPQQSAKLSSNLILSHAAGVGEAFPEDVVRAAMLIRANTLAGGHSGVRPVIIETLLDMLNAAITPVVPSQGSLGSSGDLAPLAHLTLVMLDIDKAVNAGGAQAWFQGDLLPAAEAMDRAGIPQVALGPKEGLALTNGATFTAALLALSVLDSAQMLAQSEIAAAISLEALLGVPDAFDPRLHRARPHPGQGHVAARIRAITAGSTLLGTGPQVQDPYSLRCIPQIHGPAEELLGFVAPIAGRELNSATDNPLIFDRDVISGGNFHGQPLGLAADYLKLPLTEIGALAERRVFRLTSAHTNRGLPAMLVASPEQAGLQSGLMMLQYTAASLALENQSLSAPDSILSLPTSAGQEDLNANSTTAARRLRDILRNVATIIAIECIAAGQALELRLGQLESVSAGAGTTAALGAIRALVPFADDDRPQTAYIESVRDALFRGDLIRAVQDEVGALPGWEEALASEAATAP
jgi:histidine ammonia-lyase